LRNGSSVVDDALFRVSKVHVIKYFLCLAFILWFLWLFLSSPTKFTKNPWRLVGL